MDLRKNLLLFSTGGWGYVGLEYLWRGRSHPTMFLLGGLCFLGMGKLDRLPPALRPLAGSGLCTAGELAFGLLFNRDFGIWDYRRLPMNLFGQICLTYSILWAILSIPAMGLYQFLGRKLPGEN